MGGMMFPSLEGVRAAVDLLRRLGAIGDHVTAEDQLSLEPVAALERERYFATFMGRGNAGHRP
jgi:NitT/TauT family transport system substrate-binding protein